MISLPTKRGGRRTPRRRPAALVSIKRYAQLVGATPDQVQEWIGKGLLLTSKGQLAPPTIRTPPPGYVRVRDFAASHEKSRAWVYQLIALGKLASCRVPTGGGYFRTFVPPWETLDEA